MARRKNTKTASTDQDVAGITSRLFWEKRALDYTPPFKGDVLVQTNRVISVMESKGLSMEGARILDVGSGPGTFALPLALRGASVTALDISGNMLKRLAAEARCLDMSGVKTIRTSWKEFDPVKAGFSGAFDIVLSALSIAVKTKRDILKMEQCSRQWCVCIATGRIRRATVCETALRMFHASLNPRPDIRSIREKLEQMGRAFSYESFPVAVQGKKTVAELAEDVAKRLEAEGKAPDRQKIADAVSSLFKDSGENDTIECTRHSDRGVLMWRVD